ncbi:hypothetical protein F0344_03615 [Streptomyces finlayi]|uniref:Lipoprotein n=1 Tax=Streptomyces finlayi TaxID=67296 RepID=A0A7G7BEQ0_9ACTN|nr:hypothetical protein [Streptomyces finlayi]QNE73815.1 hypothetical protein F0344_03615 [Streptomyces finlayi]
MRRLPLAVAAGLLVLTACGTERVTSGDGPEGAGSPSRARPSTAEDWKKSADEARAKHDRKFRDVAARCTDITPSASARPTTGATEPADPEADRYRENHAFKQQAPLGPEQQCRGDAHADRITDALRETGGPGPSSEQDVRTVLEELGYPAEATQVYGSGHALGFSISVPGAPCVSGGVGPPLTVEAHGVYMEGGCREPQGGH